MQSAINELKQILSQDAPTIFKLLGNSLLELNEKVKELAAKKQDKIESPSVEVPAAELTYQGPQRKLWKICNTPPFETETAIKIHTFLSTIE
jgi:hypothetical protein